MIPVRQGLSDVPPASDPLLFAGTRDMLRRWLVANPIETRRSGERVLRARWRLIVMADPCSYCYREPETLDHIVGRKKHRGGSFWTNIAGACSSCNNAKGSTPLLRYIRREKGHKRRSRNRYNSFVPPIETYQERLDAHAYKIAQMQPFGLFAGKLARAVEGLDA